MRSTLLRRFLIIMIIVMLVGASLILAGNIIVSKDVHVDNEMSELIPKATAVKNMLSEYMAGNITREAFERLSKTIVETTCATTVLLSRDGEISYMYDYDTGLTSEDIERDLSSAIKQTMEGQSLHERSVHTEKCGDLLLVSMPVLNNTGSVVGGVLLVKSLSSVNTIIYRMNMTLIWLSLIAVVLLVLLATWRVSVIAEPLRNMADMAMDMANGDLDVRVAGEDAPGEVGLLARSLNELTDKLSKTIFQLRSEKSQLNLILSSLSDGVAATDGVGMLTHYNPALKRMFGAVNVHCREDLVSDARIWDTFDRVYLTGNTETTTYHLPGDKTIWITISAVITDAGERTGVVGLFKDMTEVERLEEMRREYVANVSHELRTPLTAVRGLLEPLADGLVTDEATRERYYKTMLHEVMRLSRLITDMLALSKLQSKNEVFELSAVDMNEVVTDVADSFHAAVSERGIIMPLDVDDDAIALTNADRVEQLLVILISNAIRYTPDGGCIAISVKKRDRLIVSVEDNGCGIPEEDLPHVFERYYKVDKSRKEGGTGLGLSIAEAIIDKLDEKITVESQVGKGTRFEFTLKRYVSDAIALGPVTEPELDVKGENKGISELEETPDKKGKGASRKNDKRRNSSKMDAPFEVLGEDSR